jgi:DNA repair exonuclease SbcCD ATPase subunit
VIIDTVDLRGFGSLGDRVFRFSSALNVVVGPNEAGKSTLLRAIQALLYGHFQDSAAWAGAAASDRFRPWSGAAYAGVLQLRLANGDRYRIDRHFDDERTTVFRDPDMTDVTAAYNPGDHGWVDFADRHLGLTPAVFRASAWIQLDEVAPGRDIEVLHARLKLLADSGGTERSAQDALNTLDAWLDHRVNLAPEGMGNGPLARARALVCDLEERLRRSRVALDDLANIVAEQLRGTAAEADIRAELQRRERLIAWHEARELAAKLGRLADVEERTTELRAKIDRLADVATVTEASLDDAARVLGEASRLRAEVERLAAQARQEDGDRTRIARDLAELAPELDRLSPASRATLADLSAAQAAVEQWGRAADRVREATDSLASIQRRQKEAAANRDARLNRLPRVTVDELRETVASATGRQSSHDAAARRSTEHPAESDIRAEAQSLQSQLHGLTADELRRMHALETDLNAEGSPSSARKPGPVWPLAGLGAIVGMIGGYVAFASIGAAIGTAGLGAATFFVSYRVSTGRATEPPSPSRVLLNRWLADYGAQSVDELQRRLERHSQLQEQLGEARRLQEAAEAARRAYASVLDDLERVSGTRDVIGARQSLDLLETWVSEQSELARAEHESQAALEQARREIDDRLPVARAALDRLGLATEDPLQARGSLASLQADRERRAALLQRQAAQQADLDRLETTIHELDKRRRELAAAEAIIPGRLAAVGVAGPDPDSAGAVADRRERWQSYRDATLALAVQEQLRPALLGGANPDEWRAKLAELRPMATQPDPDDSRTLDELRSDGERLRGDLDVAQGRLAALATRRQRRIDSLVEPAELEEQLADATAVLARLQHLATVLQEARSLIKTVAEEHRRNFAPRLGDSVSSWLARATNQRYTQVEVSPTDLSVTLARGDHAGFVTLDQVSRGTRDAIALLFRASVVDLLSDTGEPVPLFLDDPLVHIDPERSQAIVELLLDLAQSRQIFYCTQDPRIVEWVSQRGDCCVQTLGIPAIGG